MMSMSMRACVAPRESEASLERRARVLVYRLRRGEMIAPEPTDPVFSYVVDLWRTGPRVPDGNAHGAIPEAM